MGPASFGEGVGGDDSDSDVPPLDQLLAELDAEAAEEDAAQEAEGAASPRKEKEEPGFGGEVPRPAQQAPFATVRPVIAQEQRPRFEPRLPEEELEIPTSRLGDVGTVNEVRRRVARIKSLSNKGLERECSQTGLPYDANFERGAFLEALRDLVVWQHLPLLELDKECKARGLRVQAPQAFGGKGLNVGFSNVRRQKECLQALAEDLRERLCRRIWESQGIPVSRVDNLEACEYLAERYSVIEAMDMQELLEWYRGLGLPTEQSLSAEVLRSLAKSVELWNCMSWASLRGECERRDASVEPPEREDGEPCPEEGEEHREALVNRLLTKALLDRWEQCGLPAHKLGLDACVHAVQKCEEWRVMGSAELRKLCAEMNLPEERGVEKQELVKTLRTMLVWGLLPVAELQDACREQGLPAEKSTWEEPQDPAPPDVQEEEDQELRSQLMQRLMVRRLTSVYERKGIPAKELDAGTVLYLYEELGKLDGMGHPELAKACQESGLPVAPEAAPQDLRKLMRHLHIWSALPEASLREECRSRDISGRALAKSHEDLLGLLLGDVCRSSFDALGIPVDRLGSYKNCQQVMLEWSAIGSMSIAEKVSTYRDMGFSSAPSDPELSDRLRRVHVWLNLPFKELQKACRKHDVNSIGQEQDRNELVGDIIGKLWGERMPTPSTRYPQPPSSPGWSRGSTQHRSQAHPAPHWGGSKGGPRGGHGPPGWGGKGGTGKGHPSQPQGRSWAAHHGPHPNPFGHPAWGGGGQRFVPPDFSKGQTYGFASHTFTAPRGRSEEVPENILRHFRLLELPVTAGAEEVRKAYRKLALKCHPDKQQPGSSASAASAEEFHRLAHAQEELTVWLRRSAR